MLEVETDEGLTGIGETLLWGPEGAELGILRGAIPLFIGESPSTSSVCLIAPSAELPRSDTAVRQPGVRRPRNGLGTSSARPRGSRFTGLWAALSTSTSSISALCRGDSRGVGLRARRAVADGFEVIYAKIGRGEDLDLEIVAAVREGIGDRRLRLDANEIGDTLTAIRMINRIAPFKPEFIEQPTPSHSIEALAHVKASVDVPVAADQSVYTIADVRGLQAAGGRRDRSGPARNGRFAGPQESGGRSRGGRH